MRDPGRERRRDRRVDRVSAAPEDLAPGGRRRPDRRHDHAAMAPRRPGLDRERERREQKQDADDGTEDARETAHGRGPYHALSRAC